MKTVHIDDCQEDSRLLELLNYTIYHPVIDIKYLVITWKLIYLHKYVLLILNFVIKPMSSNIVRTACKQRETTDWNGTSSTMTHIH